MIPILPDGAAPTEGAIDGPCNANTEPAETAAEARRIVGFDDQMQVIVLHAEL